MSIVREIFYNLGKQDALLLRAEARDLTDTEIIARENAIPDFDPNKDYSSWPAYAPVKDEGQVWLLLQPYNAAYYQGRPMDLPALWALTHTTNPDHAKPWVNPLGTSGMYMIGECYVDENGIVWRCLNDNTVHTAAAYPAGWEQVGE